MNIGVNSRESIELRNRAFLDDEFKMNEKEWLNLIKKIGHPAKKYKKGWSPDNPTKGWCGGVTNAFRLSNRVPENYIIGRQMEDEHYYFINPSNMNVIDLTVYQFPKDYEHDYIQYRTNKLFFNVLPNNVVLLMDALKLKWDDSNFIKIIKTTTYIGKVKKNPMK